MKIKEEASTYDGPRNNVFERPKRTSVITQSLIESKKLNSGLLDIKESQDEEQKLSQVSPLQEKSMLKVLNNQRGNTPE